MRLASRDENHSSGRGVRAAIPTPGRLSRYLMLATAHCPTCGMERAGYSWTTGACIGSTLSSIKPITRLCAQYTARATRQSMEE